MFYILLQGQGYRLKLKRFVHWQTITKNAELAEKADKQESETKPFCAEKISRIVPERKYKFTECS